MGQRAFWLALAVAAGLGAGAHAQDDCGGEGAAAGDCGGEAMAQAEVQVPPGAAATTTGTATTTAASADVPADTPPGSAARFRICAEPGRWGTSADYLQRTARCVYDGSPHDQDALRVALVEDIYIKSWSYAVLNKGFFWLSMALAALVLAWPALGAILKPADPPKGEEAPPPTRLQRTVTAPSVQTSVTALAAFCFAFYAHYKDKQAVSETLMRSVLYAEAIDGALISQVVGQMTEMDKGFGFATSAKPPGG